MLTLSKNTENYSEMGPYAFILAYIKTGRSNMPQDTVPSLPDEPFRQEIT